MLFAINETETKYPIGYADVNGAELVSIGLPKKKKEMSHQMQMQSSNAQGMTYVHMNYEF